MGFRKLAPSTPQGQLQALLAVMHICLHAYLLACLLGHTQIDMLACQQSLQSRSLASKVHDHAHCSHLSMPALHVGQTSQEASKYWHNMLIASGKRLVTSMQRLFVQGFLKLASGQTAGGAGSLHQQVQVSPPTHSHPRHALHFMGGSLTLCIGKAKSFTATTTADAALDRCFSVVHSYMQSGQHVMSTCCVINS